MRVYLRNARPRLAHPQPFLVDGGEAGGQKKKGKKEKKKKRAQQQQQHHHHHHHHHHQQQQERESSRPEQGLGSVRSSSTETLSPQWQARPKPPVPALRPEEFPACPPLSERSARSCSAGDAGGAQYWLGCLPCSACSNRASLPFQARPR